MSVDSVSVNPPSSPASWRQRWFLLLIIACFALPLVTAWLLVDRWRPAGSVQHGELLNPAHPLDLRFDLAEKVASTMRRYGAAGRWFISVRPGNAIRAAKPLYTTCGKSAWR